MRSSAFGDVHLAYCPHLMSPGHKHPQSHKNTHRYHPSTAVLQSDYKACRYRKFAIPPCRCVANARCTCNASWPIWGHKNTQLHDRSAPRGCFVHPIPGRGHERPKWFWRQFMCITSCKRRGALLVQCPGMHFTRGPGGHPTACPLLKYVTINLTIRAS